MSNTPQYFAIIPAAGSGVRFGGDTKKQFLMLDGKSLLERTIETFSASQLFSKIVICLPRSELNLIHLKEIPQNVVFVEGGNTRSESVFNGFRNLEATEDDVVLIHDAVRPLVSQDLIRLVAQTVLEKKAVIPAVAIADTIKEVEDGKVRQTVDRRLLQAVQTPQGFSYRVLQLMYAKKPALDQLATDESFLVEAAGYPVYVVAGERSNIKITTADDMAYAGFVLAGRK